MKYSLAVRDREKAKRILKGLYDEHSPFCIYEPGMEAPKGKFLIAISKNPLDIPNVIFYVSSINKLLEGKNLVYPGFPEEDFTGKKEEQVFEKRRVVHREKEEEKEAHQDVFEVDRKRVPEKIVEKKKKPEKQPEKKEPVKAVVSAEKEQPKKKNVVEVEDRQTAVTVAVSLHKFKPSTKIEIEDDELAELYGVIDVNLVAVHRAEGRGIVIRIGNGKSGLEKYKGKEYTDWQEIARSALRCLR